MSRSKVGIVGYGVYVPWERIRSEEVVKEREKGRKDLRQFLEKVRYGLHLNYKSVADTTEDTITIAAEAAENSLHMAQVKPLEIGSVAVGSESKPYAVGTIARHVASFLGIGENVFIADLEGACNSGMQGVSYIEAQIRTGRIKYGLAIGADVAQAPKGDPLEYAAGAGAGAFVIGKSDVIATIEDVAPYSSLFMDFWRREESPVPRHFGRTTVEAYQKHVIGAIEGILRRNPDMTLRDFDQITFHQPSGYLPLKTCQSLCQASNEFDDPSITERIRLTPEDIERKVKPWLRVMDTGNTYAASTLIAVASILDRAEPGDNILAVSYGSGAYANATWLQVQDGIEQKRELVPKVDDYVGRKHEIRIETYKDIIRQRLSRIHRKIALTRLVGEIEPLGQQGFDMSLCQDCKRIYFPAREKCLNSDCKGPARTIWVPRRASMLSFKRLALKKRWTSNFELLNEGKTFFVDCRMNDLKVGMEVEAVIRRLHYEGKEGLISYGLCYRPIFRERFYDRRETTKMTVPQYA